MTDRTCSECGETKPSKSFLDAKRRVVGICTDCRRKAKERARYLRAKAASRKRDRRVERDDAILAQEQLLAHDPAAEVLAEIKSLMYAPRHKLRQYLNKVELGIATLRTEQGIKRQRQRMDYLEHLCEIIERDALLGRASTLQHYLTNTYVLNEHGYTCNLNLDDEDIRVHKTKEFTDADN
jgi:hypothetical protein